MKRIFLTLIILGFAFILKTGEVQAQTCPTLPTNTGRVTLTAENVTTGTYRVWSRIKAPDTTNNSFYLQIDSNCAVLVGNSTSIPANTWTWVDYSDGNSTNKINVNLTAGNHVITIIGNEPSVGVDKLLMTKNLTCIPTGIGGDNCPAEITVSPTSGPVDTSTPVISNISATNITPSAATINWFLNEVATGQVQYGPTTAYGSLSTKETSFNWDHHVQNVSGLTAGTTYHYRVISSDQSGNTTTSTDCTFTTPTSGTTASIACSASAPNPTATKTPTPTLTKAPTPIPTAIPNSTILRFQTIKLHGIGSGGDNTNPNAQGTIAPIVTTRNFEVELSGSNSSTNYPISNGNITYKTTTQDFSGDIVLDQSIPSGLYLVFVRSPQYLKKQLTGILTINKGTTNLMPSVTLVTGDINSDLKIDLSDYNILIGCYSDLLAAKDCDATRKAAADLTSDGKVNADDYGLFLRERSVVYGD